MIQERFPGGLEERSPYHQFRVGDQLQFRTNSLDHKGKAVAKPTSMVVEKIAGGGFFGRVLIPQDGEFVVKTTVPDPWHDLWRRVNWGFQEFPSQVDETQAKLDHVATRIIHEALPPLTNGAFRSPGSSGYTHFPNGFAQVLERMRGRGPRYDLPTDEVSEFKQAQTELAEIAFQLGLEHVAQILPQNPFSLPNIWKDAAEGKWIWLDTLPALPHKGFYWPWYRYDFHKVVKARFYPGQDPNKVNTFNKIHTDMARDAVSRHSYKFSTGEEGDLRADLNLYDDLQKEREGQKLERKNFVAVPLAASGTIYEAVPRAVKAVGRSTVGQARMLFSKDYMAHEVLKGVARARDESLITDQEYTEAESLVLSSVHANKKLHKELGVLGTMLGFYAITARAIDAGELVAYKINFDHNFIPGHDALSWVTNNAVWMLVNGGIWIAGRVAPSATRGVGTRAIGGIYNVDTRAASVASMLPIAGNVLPLSFQISSFVKDKGEVVGHYTARDLIAKASRIVDPAKGGWGSEAEAKLWKRYGKKLEGLIK